MKPTAASNNSLNPTGMSLSLIENLSHDAVVSRRVNSGVRFLLNGVTHNSTSTFTNPERPSSPPVLIHLECSELGADIER